MDPSLRAARKTTITAFECNQTQERANGQWEGDDGGMVMEEKRAQRTSQEPGAVAGSRRVQTNAVAHYNVMQEPKQAPRWAKFFSESSKGDETRGGPSHIFPEAREQQMGTTLNGPDLELESPSGGPCII